MKMNEFDKRIQTEISQLPKKLEPKRDLWTGVERAIEQPSNQVKSSNRDSAASAPIYALAASVMFLALTLVVLVTNQYSTPQHQSHYALEMQSQHEAQMQAMLASYANKTPIRSDWQQRMLELDQAENAILAALENDPNNHALLKLLQQIYQQQLSLIETVYHPKWQAI